MIIVWSGKHLGGGYSSKRTIVRINGSSIKGAGYASMRNSTGRWVYSVSGAIVKEDEFWEAFDGR